MGSFLAGFIQDIHISVSMIIGDNVPLMLV